MLSSATAAASSFCAARLPARPEKVSVAEWPADGCLQSRRRWELRAAAAN